MLSFNCFSGILKINWTVSTISFCYARNACTWLCVQFAKGSTVTATRRTVSMHVNIYVCAQERARASPRIRINYVLLTFFVIWFSWLRWAGGVAGCQQCGARGQLACFYYWSKSYAPNHHSLTDSLSPLSRYLFLSHSSICMSVCCGASSVFRVHTLTESN